MNANLGVMFRPARLKTLASLALACYFALTDLTPIARADDPFPQASAIDSGLNADAVELFSQQIDRFVERDMIVGAEVHIIKDRKTILHRAYGWADRDAERKMELESVFCVRSMTKPVLGTVVQMLIDEGKLSLDQRVAEILKEFDQEKTRQITIGQLLTHTSGLPMSAINRPLSEYPDLRSVAADAAKAGVGFQPGTSFQYSDAGSDSLGAIVSEVTGMSADEFIKRRILEPLKMDDSLTLVDKADPRTLRIPSAYSGGPRNWQRHWQASDPPLLPLFLTSQGLFCTTTDYARFLTLWMDKGRLGDRQMLSSAAVERSLAPGWHFSDEPARFESRDQTYGQLWVVHHDEQGNGPGPFGHSGSDGTFAWAWPEEDLIVLVFTQSRGTLVGAELENTISDLLIAGDVEGYRKKLLASSRARESYERLTGIYWDEDVETDYYVVRVDEAELIVERPGRFQSIANPLEEDGHFSAAGGSITLQFEGEVDQSPSVMLMKTPGKTERQVRHETNRDLPDVEAIMASASKAHGLDRLGDQGVVLLSGNIKAGLFGRTGTINQWFDGRRLRTEIQIGSSKEVLVINGNDVVTQTNGAERKILDGIARRQAVLSHPAVQYGGWSESYNELELLKQFSAESEELLLLRVYAAGLPTSTLVIDAKTGLLVREQSLQMLPGMGFIGAESRFSDFQAVGGMTLPFRIESKFAHPLLGRNVIQFDKFETHVEQGDLFQISDPK